MPSEKELDMEPFNPPRVIETDKLWLRPFVESDAEQFYYALFGDPAVTEWLPIRTLESVDEARAYIAQCEKGWNNRTLFTWALEDKQTGHLCALIELRPCLPRVELGVATTQRPGWRRLRAATEAMCKLIDWTLAQPNIYRIFVCCSPHGKSAPLMERIGFTFEGRLTNWEARPNRGLEADDALIFARTRVPPPLDSTPLKKDEQIDQRGTGSTLEDTPSRQLQLCN